MNRRPLSSQPTAASQGTWIVGLLGLFFLLTGCTTAWFLTVVPCWRLWQAQRWVTTECTIVDSRTDEVDGVESTTFRPQIRYEYQVNGVSQTASRYTFFNVASSRNWAKKIVDQYPVGSQQTCYYDPAAPHEAVLLRSFFSDVGFWFGLLFPWPFIIAGALMTYFGFPRKSAGKTPLPPDSARELNRLQSPPASPAESANFSAEFSSELLNPPGHARSSGELTALSPPYSTQVDWQRFAGPLELAPTVSRTAALIGTGLFALFWNGIISLFVWNMIADGYWFALLFLLPFVLVGLALLGIFVYTLLSLFNPQVKIALSEGAPELGETVDIAWEVSGQVARIADFRILAVGEEQATYTRGTDTTTDRNVFQSLEICRLTNPDEIRFGTGQLQVPLETMHSHSGPRNKIVWQLQVRGRIPWFPDISEDYEFHVLPRGVR